MTSQPPAPDDPPELLRIAVARSIRHYLDTVDPDQVRDLYAMVLREMDTALLPTILDYTQGNQSLAADMLGISRVTLRKKIKGLSIPSAGE